MKQKFLFLAVLCLPTLGLCQGGSSPDKVGVRMTTLRQAQGDSGIKWVEGLSWEQVKQKAKKENKYIFIDCYATWCKPCKEMDQKVYTIDSVGDFLNEGFISVKLQMDRTKNDNDAVRSWYITARDIETKYRISAYPSYIFFAPNGDVVSKETGYKDPKNFLQVVRNATDPSKQYFVLLKKYKLGKLDHNSTVSLIKMAQQIGDTADYRQVLTSYFSYLRKLKKQKLYTKENIEFIASTLQSSKDVFFSMFYRDGKDVDKAMNSNGYAKKIVDKIISKEKVSPFLKTAAGKSEPDWGILFNSIAKDYTDEYAGRNVLDAKVEWYGTRNNILKYATALNDRIEQYGPDTTYQGGDFILNNRAWLLWEKGFNDTTQMNRMLNWLKEIVRRGEKATGDYIKHAPNYIDTYANFLHKAGRTTEAIKWQEYAIIKKKEAGASEKELEDFRYILEKMKKGEPTW